MGEGLQRCWVLVEQSLGEPGPLSRLIFRVRIRPLLCPLPLQRILTAGILHCVCLGDFSPYPRCPYVHPRLFFDVEIGEPGSVGGREGKRRQRR